MTTTFSPDVRWVPRRKAELLRQIDAGEITEADAMARYDLSADELAEWRIGLAIHGREGLKVTKTQRLRGYPLRMDNRLADYRRGA